MPDVSIPAARLSLAAGLILLELALTAGAAYVVLLGATWGWGPAWAPSLPPSVRALGLGVIAVGLGFGVATFRYRPPKDMLVSTSITLEKLFFRKPVGTLTPRTEPFVAVGPYRYTRNPLYLGVLAVIGGLGLLLDSVLLLLWTATLLDCYWFVLIPFEEKELAALFGATYADYRRHVPRLVPYKSKYQPPRAG